MERNVVNWFEIPVVDIERAVKFYNELLGFNLEIIEFGGARTALFPTDLENPKPGTGGSLFEDTERKPSENGVLIYFESPSDNCSIEEENAKKLGALIQEKTELPQGQGFMIKVKDSEGNHIAIGSMK